jgi:DNA repair photolyase
MNIQYIDKQLRKGRGALNNPANRFYGEHSETVDDGWYQSFAENSMATVVREEQAKTIISRNKSPDVPFMHSINPYRGCEHGCSYCFARPTHAYWDMSPGLDFETRIISKPNAAVLLARELAHPKYICDPIALGVNTDAYQPLEKKLRITRGILEVLREYRHPFSIITKGSLLLRDLDIIAEMARSNLCSVAVSLTTLDVGLKRVMEPRAASPASRLKMIETLSQAGVPVTVLMAPVIPFINDSEIEAVLTASRDAGARRVGYVFIRLPLEVGQLFTDWLEAHFPERAAHVMNMIRDARGGKNYQSEFGTRMVGQGPVAELIKQRFKICERKLGLNDVAELKLDCSQFTGGSAQLGLFD